MNRFGKQPPRHKFFLNPYKDARFTSCPKCEAKTKLRKFPLFIFLEPMQPLVLNKTCRYCPSCDLLILHQDELEQLLATMCMQQGTPHLIGNDYLVIGTVDRADWKKGQLTPISSIEGMRSIIHDFKKVLEFELQSYGWIKDDEA